MGDANGLIIEPIEPCCWHPTVKGGEQGGAENGCQDSADYSVLNWPWSS